MSYPEGEHDSPPARFSKKYLTTARYVNPNRVEAIPEMNPVQVSRISLAQDFSPYPSGRYMADGNFSAEQFRREQLIPTLKQAEKNATWVVVSLDEVAGVSASFLEEAFGGLVREGMSKEFLDKHLQISTSQEVLQDFVIMAQQYIQDAECHK